MPTLGYWKIRGVPCPANQIDADSLTYAGVEFDDVTYEQGDGPEFSREAWYSVKQTLGLPFPNLPYYLDDGVKITQSNSIIRYIAKKNNLLGKTTQEQVDCDVMLENAMDFRNGTVRLCYNKDYLSLKDNYFENLKGMLTSFENYLGDKKFFAGNEVTACDFPMYELLDQHTIMKPGILEDYPKLKAFHDRFQNLPKIKAYLASAEKLPLNNKSAAFH